MRRISLRISIEQARVVKALAKAMGISVSEVFRIAIAEYIERCRLDRDMQRRRRRAGERDWEVFEIGG
jgi:hypothetical protein